MRKIAIGFAAIAALTSTSAFAATASNTMDVSVNVINSCTVAASPMAFGGVNSIGGTDIDTTATIVLTCTNGANYVVGLDNGTHSVGAQRNLANAGGTTIPYGIFTNVARNAAWGSNPGVDTVAGTSGATGVSTLTAYGRIPASATTVTAGTYTDTVTVTVTF